MALRLFLLALAVAGTAALVATWRRPSRRLSRALTDLPAASIVQFTAPYCAPCKRNRPHLEDAARGAGLPYVEIDVGERPEMARRLGIRSVPVIVVTGADGTILARWREPPPNGDLHRAAREAHGAALG